jgi:hypothetical protein
LKEEMAWGVAGERRSPELERHRSSRGGVRCKGEGDTESAGEVERVGGRKERKKKKKRRGRVGVVRASWVSHHAFSDVWHYATSEFQKFC